MQGKRVCQVIGSGILSTGPGLRSGTGRWRAQRQLGWALCTPSRQPLPAAGKLLPAFTMPPTSFQEASAGHLWAQSLAGHWCSVNIVDEE